MIKISIAGIHGSGKTTLIHKIKKLIESYDKTVYHVDEVARRCPTTLGTIESQRWIWESHINEEIEGALSDCDIILCDRTLLDNLIYYKYLLNGEFDPIFLALSNYTIDWMKTYDYISFLKMNPEFIINDGVRITDINKTIKINELFIKYLKPHENINLNRFNYGEKIIKIIKTIP